MLMMIAAVLTAMWPASDAVKRSQIEQARELFEERLLDYPSARFRNVTGNDRVICGFVNAKNRLGAYVGWEGFVIVQTDGTSTLRLNEADEPVSLVYELYCMEGRTPVSPDLSDRIKAG
ncbi:MAG: hypothetical protein FJX25_18490 [Alphaproteobacteria bacterium]|nr:hypothetical protein [Alphaproteobacteria bacterium]